MIFLFFGTSVALLEAELAPFKDLEEIGKLKNYEQVKSRPSLGKMTHMCVFATLLMYFLLNGASVTVYLFLLVVILVSL